MTRTIHELHEDPQQQVEQASILSSLFDNYVRAREGDLAGGRLRRAPRAAGSGGRGVGANA